MESMEINTNFWKDKTVFLTGHTGFKGGWITLWLNKMGAKVHGYGLPPKTKDNFFSEAKINQVMASSFIGDINDSGTLLNSIKRVHPEIIFHMAAQPIVRESYLSPVSTFKTNIFGTINVLEAARKVNSIKAIVNITTDKCYESREWVWPYRENDSLGGYDPYSASKACSELVSASYRNSFFKPQDVHVATVRAGNVIGGGDWSNDRLIPDFLRSIDNGKVLKIRSPNSVRPWQHVLEPLSGYLLLAEKLYEKENSFDEAWNFGPVDEDTKTVRWIVDKLCEKISGVKYEIDISMESHETHSLKLDSTKAKSKLGWAPRWNLENALSKTLEWHQAWKNDCDMSAISIKQILDYQNS